jgi:hypothetical protein
MHFGNFTDMKWIHAAYRIFKSGVKPWPEKCGFGKRERANPCFRFTLLDCDYKRISKMDSELILAESYR